MRKIVRGNSDTNGSVYYQDIDKLRTQIRTSYENKYYNLFIKMFKFGGVLQNKIQEPNYIMRQFWATGTVAAFGNSLLADFLGFAPYAAESYNLYDFVEEFTLVNERNSAAIPSGVKVNGVDGVIGYLKDDHKGMRATIKPYIDKIVEIELVINSNLQTHKMPFVVGISPEDAAKAKDIVSKILRGETVIFHDLNELQAVKVLATNSPYIIDKLYGYKTAVENELLTVMGIDNAGFTDGISGGRNGVLLDEVNANNVIINAYAKGMLDNLKAFFAEIKTVFNKAVTVESNYTIAASEHSKAKDNTDNNEDAEEDNDNEL